MFGQSGPDDRVTWRATWPSRSIHSAATRTTTPATAIVALVTIVMVVMVAMTVVAGCTVATETSYDASGLEPVPAYIEDPLRRISNVDELIAGQIDTAALNENGCLTSPWSGELEGRPMDLRRIEPSAWEPPVIEPLAADFPDLAVFVWHSAWGLHTRVVSSAGEQQIRFMIRSDRALIAPAPAPAGIPATVLTEGGTGTVELVAKSEPTGFDLADCLAQDFSVTVETDQGPLPAAQIFLGPERIADGNPFEIHRD